MSEDYKKEFLDSLTDKEKTFYSEPMNQTLHSRFESFIAGRRVGKDEGYAQGGYAQGFESRFPK